jgi:hypothetical protein
MYDKPLAARRSENVVRNELCHLKHRDLLFAIKDRPHWFVSVDHSLLLGVLQFVGLDIVPQPLCQFGPWERAQTNYHRQFVIWLNGSHECRVPFLHRSFCLGHVRFYRST